MIVIEYPYKDEKGVLHYGLERRYSDSNRFLIQLPTGIKYEQAIDKVPSPYTYKESETEIK